MAANNQGQQGQQRQQGQNQQEQGQNQQGQDRQRRDQQGGQGDQGNQREQSNPGGSDQRGRSEINPSIQQDGPRNRTREQQEADEARRVLEDDE